MAYNDYRLSDDGATVTFHGADVPPVQLPANLDAAREAMTQFDADKRAAQDRVLEAPFDATDRKRGGIVSAVETPDLTMTQPMGRPWMARERPGGIVSSVEYERAPLSDVAQGRGGIVSSRYTIEEQPRSTGTVTYGPSPMTDRLDRLADSHPLYREGGGTMMVRGGAAPTSEKDRELLGLLDQIDAKRAAANQQTMADLDRMEQEHPLSGRVAVRGGSVPMSAKDAELMRLLNELDAKRRGDTPRLDALAGEAKRLSDIPVAVAPLSGPPSAGPLDAANDVDVRVSVPQAQAYEAEQPMQVATGYRDTVTPAAAPSQDLVETRSRPWEAAGDYPGAQRAPAFPPPNAPPVGMAADEKWASVGPIAQLPHTQRQGMAAASEAQPPAVVDPANVSVKAPAPPEGVSSADGTVGPTVAYALDRLRNMGRGAGGSPAVTAAEAAGVTGPIREAADRDKEILRRAAEQNVVTHGKAAALGEAGSDIAGAKAKQELDIAKRIESDRRAIWQAGEDNERELRSKTLDPNRTWKELGGFGRTAAAVFMGLGEFARLYLHANQNGAKEVIDDAINRDIMQQQADYTRGVERGKRVQGLLADYINAGFPMDAAKRLATSAIQERVIEQRKADLEDAKLRMTPVQLAQAQADIDKQAKANEEARLSALADWKRKAAAGYDPLKRLDQEVGVIGKASVADRNIDKLGANSGNDGAGPSSVPVYNSAGEVVRHTTSREANQLAYSRAQAQAAHKTAMELANVAKNTTVGTPLDWAHVRQLQTQLAEEQVAAVTGRSPNKADIVFRRDNYMNVQTPGAAEFYRRAANESINDYDRRISTSAPSGATGSERADDKPTEGAEPAQ